MATPVSSVIPGFIFVEECVNFYGEIFSHIENLSNRCFQQRKTEKSSWKFYDFYEPHSLDALHHLVVFTMRQIEQDLLGNFDQRARE